MDVLHCVITMYDSKGDGQANLLSKMPTDVEFGTQLDEYS